MHSTWLWIVFNAFVLVLLALDLGVFHRKAHRVGVREAAIWSAVWVTLALVFNFGIYQTMGSEAGLAFLAAYLLEKSLSVDNIFVFVLIFSYFRVPEAYQHRVLFWGVLGALVLRGTMIGVGALLLLHFHWILYVFGAFLVVTGVRMGFQRGHSVHLEQNPLFRFVRRWIPVTDGYHGGRFFIREAMPSGGWRRVATPLFIVLLLVEMSDLLFAVDSIPAVFAVTQDPFLVYTSNVLAILGLRSLYFLLAGVMSRFVYLQQGLAVVLAFVGLKMLVVDFYKVPVGLSLGVIVVVLTVAVLASLVKTRAQGQVPLGKLGGRPPVLEPARKKAPHEV